MKLFTIIGFAAGTIVAGCAANSGARSEPTTSGAIAPNPHEHGGGDHGGMMAGMCPMKVSGTTVAATDVDGGIALTFTTKGESVAEVRQRVRRMAEMHNNAGSGEHQHVAGAGAGHVGGGQGGMMMGGGMMMPAATASVEDLEGGARLILRPNDPAHLATLQEHVRMKAKRMAHGECSSDADHDTHDPGK